MKALLAPTQWPRRLLGRTVVVFTARCAHCLHADNQARQAAEHAAAARRERDRALRIAEAAQIRCDELRTHVLQLEAPLIRRSAGVLRPVERAGR